MASKHTRMRIRNTFLEMLNETPLHKITINQLSEKCEMNRNTFYYHYSDIYELLSEIFRIELQRVRDDYKDSLSWEESFLIAAEFALENKRIVFHIYHSLRREEVENYIFKVAENVMIRHIDKVSENIPATDEDKKLIAYFYQCALTEMLLRWISCGMDDDPRKVILRIGKLFDGNIEMSLKRSHASHKLINNNKVN